MMTEHPANIDQIFYNGNPEGDFRAETTPFDRNDFFEQPTTTEVEVCQQDTFVDKNSWIRMFVRNDIEDDDDLSITDEFLMPQESLRTDEDWSILEAFAASFNTDEPEEHYDDPLCHNINFRDSFSTDGEPIGVASSYMQEAIDTTDLNDCMHSLNDQFEQLNKCMERTSRTREMIQKAGLINNNNNNNNNNNIHSSSPNLGGLDMMDNNSNIHHNETWGGRRSMYLDNMPQKHHSANMLHMMSSSTSSSGHDSFGSISSKGSSSGKMKRTGIAPRRARANASFPPLPKNVRASIGTRKRLLRDFHVAQMKTK
jgi:hypothetical protein